MPNPHSQPEGASGRTEALRAVLSRADKRTLGDDGLAVIADAYAELAALEAEVARLKEENGILRLYGNKDCTAMADERLAELRTPAGRQDG